MSRDPSLRQRGTRHYSFADHGNSDMGGNRGKHFIRNNLADLWAPKFEDGTTTIRIYPQKNPEDPTQWEPYRFSAEPNDFGDWIRRYPAVRNCGDPGVSFIMADPSDPMSVDQQGLPPWVLYNAVHQAIKNKQEGQGWASLTMGGKGRGPQLSRPSEVYLVQCAVMQHGQQVYGPPKGFVAEDRLIVFELSPSSGLAMLAEINKMIEGAHAPEGDWERLMVNGDPISLDFGRYVTFYTLSQGDPRTRQHVQPGGWTAAAAQQAQAQADLKGFGCFLEPSFGGHPARLRDYEVQISQKVKPWDELLYFPTLEEQAHLLADKFPADVILYAFRDHRDWIPEAVRNRAAAAVSFNAPAGGWGPAAGGGVAAAGAWGPPAGSPQQQFPQSGQAPGFGVMAAGESPAGVAALPPQPAIPQAPFDATAGQVAAMPSGGPPPQLSLLPAQGGFQGAPAAVSQTAAANMNWAQQGNSVSPPVEALPPAAFQQPAAGFAAAPLPQGFGQPPQPQAPQPPQPQAPQPPQPQAPPQGFGQPPQPQAPQPPQPQAPPQGFGQPPQPQAPPAQGRAAAALAAAQQAAQAQNPAG